MNYVEMAMEERLSPQSVAMIILTSFPKCSNYIYSLRKYPSHTWFNNIAKGVRAEFGRIGLTTGHV